MVEKKKKSTVLDVTDVTARAAPNDYVAAVLRLPAESIYLKSLTQTNIYSPGFKILVFSFK